MFLPKEDKFFDLFDKQAENIVRAAEFYRKLAEEGGFTPENVRKMHEFEHYGDELTHTTINKLNETFITPFDREDILALANRMDAPVGITVMGAGGFREPVEDQRHVAAGAEPPRPCKKHWLRCATKKA